MPLNRMRTGLVDEFTGDLTVDVLWKRTCTGLAGGLNIPTTTKDLGVCAVWTLQAPEVARRSQFAFGHSCECYPCPR
jgi:hypothetical protein